MSLDRLTERQVIGLFYKALKDYNGAPWLGKITNLFKSDQRAEEYAWIGQVPGLREWIGGRNSKGFSENSITITNRHFESTIRIAVSDMRRDKQGIVEVRLNDLIRRANNHWTELTSTLITNGTTTNGYDGTTFFATDHTEGSSGSQSNNLEVDISGLPVATSGTTTMPAVAEMQFAIAKGVQQIMSFKDNEGYPMNSDASEFIVMVPVSFMNVATQAVATPAQIAETQSVLQALQSYFKIGVVINPLLSWTEQFVIFRTDSAIKPFIRQEETDIQFKMIGYGSEHEFLEDSHLYGVDAWRNAGYAYWQNACLVTLA
jgi:phage major head subunit gpT-like protein